MYWFKSNDAGALYSHNNSEEGSKKLAKTKPKSVAQRPGHANLWGRISWSTQAVLILWAINATMIHTGLSGSWTRVKISVVTVPNNENNADSISVHYLQYDA